MSALGSLPTELLMEVLCHVSTEDIGTLSSMPELSTIIRDLVCYVYDCEKDNTEAFPHLDHRSLRDAVHLYFRKTRHSIVIAEVHNIFQNTKWLKTLARTHGDVRVIEKQVISISPGDSNNGLRGLNTFTPLFHTLTFEKITDMILENITLDPRRLRFPNAENIDMKNCDIPDGCHVKFDMPKLTLLQVSLRFAKLSKAFDFEKLPLERLTLCNIKDTGTLPKLYSTTLKELVLIGKLIMTEIQVPNLTRLSLSHTCSLMAMFGETDSFDYSEPDVVRYERPTDFLSSVKELVIHGMETPGDFNYILEKLPDLDVLEFNAINWNHLRDVSSTNSLTQLSFTLTQDNTTTFTMSDCSFPNLKKFTLNCFLFDQIQCDVSFSAPSLVDYIVYGGYSLTFDEVVIDYPLLKFLELSCDIKRLRIEHGDYLECLMLLYYALEESSLKSVSCSTPLPKLRVIKGTNVPFLKDIAELDASLLDRSVGGSMPEIGQGGDWEWTTAGKVGV